MTGFEGLLAILIVALMPVALVFISRYYALREKELSLRAEQDGRRIEQLVEDRRLLEARVEALESIVCTVEFDIDQRLHRLGPGKAGISRRALPPPRVPRARALARRANRAPGLEGAAAGTGAPSPVASLVVPRPGSEG